LNFSLLFLIRSHQPIAAIIIPAQEAAKMKLARSQRKRRGGTNRSAFLVMSCS
jgi:hypothetical protein